jgi:hypothetical protein
MSFEGRKEREEFPEKEKNKGKRAKQTVHNMLDYY